MLLKRILFILSFCSFINICLKAQEQYDKHIVIAVDQTIGNNINREEIYSALCQLLENKPTKIDRSHFMMPDNFTFNPQTDEISLFGFGLPGIDYQDMTQSRQLGSEYLFNRFSSSFIEKEGTFHATHKSLHLFLEEDLKSLINTNTPLGNRWKSKGKQRMTFSHYVYPTILKFINAQIPSSEFILIIISDFQSGAHGEGDIMDEHWMAQLMHTNFKDVTSKINKIGEPFVKVDMLDFTIGNPKEEKNDLKPLRAKGYRLLMKKTVQKSPIFITNGISPIKQTKHLGTTFEVQPATILFNKDENTDVQKIILKVYRQRDNKLLFSQIVADSIKAYEDYDKEQRTYMVEAPTINLESIVPIELKFDYIFYTVSKDNAGNNIMPYVLTASRKITKSDFEINNGYTMTFILFVFILLILCVLAYLLWQYRGRKRIAHLKYRIDRVSKLHYMDVKDSNEEGLHVMNYDCWYINEGETETNIHIRGDVSLESKFFAKNYQVLISYMIKDLDQNYDFSFRPIGKDYKGNDRLEGRFYTLSPDTKGHFEFDAVAFISKDDEGNTKSPNYIDKDNILELGIYLKVELTDKNGTVLCLLDECNNEDNPYKFIVKPNIENRDLWVAFDPGTSGSCIAYGYGGTPDSMSNIQLAKNYDVVNGWKPIMPSYLTINDTDATLAKVASGVEKLEIKKDYNFGNAAYKQEFHLNRFQSIKKLLGYNKTTQNIYSENGKEAKIAGRDLALLIIKGLLNNFERFLKENTDDMTREVKPRFMPNGILTPSRAIVAVPNNYTLTKVRDMVDSIKRTNKFKEVHYLYEAEGVMMSYLRMNWKRLIHKQHLTFIVFDMGGATINATAFRIKVNRETNGKGNQFIRDIEVSTVSKIGYCVGGDDIDYALMQIIYNIPSIKREFNKKKIDVEIHQAEYKPSVLKYIEELKLALIDRAHEEMKTGNMFLNEQTLWTSISNQFSEWGINLPMEHDTEGNSIIPKDFWNYIQTELTSHTTMKKYVFDKVQDAVMELMNNTISNSEIELIFSGRSTLYPRIEETVLGEIRNPKYHCTCKDRWHGFDEANNKYLDADKVKTAVVEGACWYALWSGRIVMKHDLVTSTFGYIDMINDEATFIPVINKNSPFENNGKKKVTVDIQDPTLKNVKFIQMLGSNYTDIIRKDIKYKKNPLVEVTANDIDGVIEKVQIEVDANNNFAYNLSIAGHKDLCGHYEAADTDILDENSPVYAFATIRNKTRPAPSNNFKYQNKKNNRKGGGL